MLKLKKEDYNSIFHWNLSLCVFVMLASQIKLKQEQYFYFLTAQNRAVAPYWRSGEEGEEMRLLLAVAGTKTTVRRTGAEGEESSSCFVGSKDADHL